MVQGHLLVDSHKILLKPPYCNGKYYQFFGALSNWFFLGSLTLCNKYLKLKKGSSTILSWLSNCTKATPSHYASSFFFFYGD